MQVVAVDAGRDSTKYTGNFSGDFHSIIGSYQPRNLKNDNERYKVTLDQHSYFVDNLAKEAVDCRSNGEQSKLHSDTKVFTLLGLALSYQEGSSIQLVTGVPVDQHTPEIKEKLTRMLVGRHEITVAQTIKGRRFEKTHQLNISEIAITCEGIGAYWDAVLNKGGEVINKDLIEGVVRLIDIGSRTCNLVTIIDRKYYNKESKNLPYGAGKITRKRTAKEATGFVEQLASDISWIWSEDCDKLLISGGGSILFNDQLRDKWPTAVFLTNPVRANVEGYYKMGVVKWRDHLR